MTDFDTHRIQNLRRKKYYVDPAKFILKHESLVGHAKSKLLYNELAPIYDLAISRDTSREAAFLNDIIKSFKPESKRILDLGCGVGRHAELLNKNYGYSVTGIDISDEVICFARIRAPSSTFLKMDLRDIHFCEKFDVAICMWTTLNYLSDAELCKFFASIQKILTDEGLLVIDVNNYGKPDVEMYSRRTGNSQYQVDVSITKRRFGRINESLYTYNIMDFSETKKFVLLDQELNMIYTVDDILNSAKSFNLISCFGDYDISTKYDEKSSKRIIFVLCKRG